MFEVFEHTADIGLRVRAPSLEQLFKEAAAAMIGLMCHGPSEDGGQENGVPKAFSNPITPQSRVLPSDSRIEIRDVVLPSPEKLPIPETSTAHLGLSCPNHSLIRLASAWEDLFHDWLSKILYLFSAERLVPIDYELHFDANGLKGRIMARRYDPARDGGEIEIKAVTYHGLKIEKRGDEFVAEVIFDT